MVIIVACASSYSGCNLQRYMGKHNIKSDSLAFHLVRCCHNNIIMNTGSYLSRCSSLCVQGIIQNLHSFMQLSSFLVMDPNKRITSEIAMADPYFSEDPKPCAE